MDAIKSSNLKIFNILATSLGDSTITGLLFRKLNGTQQHLSFGLVLLTLQALLRKLESTSTLGITSVAETIVGAVSMFTPTSDKNNSNRREKQGGNSSSKPASRANIPAPLANRTTDDSTSYTSNDCPNDMRNGTPCHRQFLKPANSISKVCVDKHSQADKARQADPAGFAEAQAKGPYNFLRLNKIDVTDGETHKRLQQDSPISFKALLLLAYAYGITQANADNANVFSFNSGASSMTSSLFHSALNPTPFAFADLSNQVSPFILASSTYPEHHAAYGTKVPATGAPSISFSFSSLAQPEITNSSMERWLNVCTDIVSNAISDAPRTWNPLELSKNLAFACPAMLSQQNQSLEVLNSMPIAPPNYELHSNRCFINSAEAYVNG
jgi:hypothetical protein